MTVTESRPAAEAEDEAHEGHEGHEHSAAEPDQTAGFAAALATGDHKAIGRMYVLFGLAGGLLALVLNVLVSIERTGINSISVLDWGGSGSQTFFQAWSLSRTSLLFFCVIPLLLGLATYVIPLQVGAPAIAFPRACAAAFWTWLVGMGIHIATVFVDGGLGVPENPVEAVQGREPEAIELSLLSIGVTTVAILVATVCVMTTVIVQRPEGMTLYEVPLFAWSMLVAGGIWLLSLPVWLANLAIIWVDFRGEDAVRYGDVEAMWDQLGWLWSQPMVFAFAIPLLGIVGDIVPVAARQRQRRYGLQQTVIAVFGAVSFGAWAQPAFNPEVSQQLLFVVLGLIVALPILAFAGGLADTLAKGSPSLSAQLVLGLLAIGMLLAGAAAAALHVSGAAIGVVRELDEDWLGEVIEPLEDLRGTVIATSVMQYVLLAALIGAVAGLYYWAPKIFGRRMLAPLGLLAGLTLVGGTVLVALSGVINGFLDEGDQVFRTVGLADAYLGVWDETAVETFNVIATIGSVLLVAGLGLVLLDVAQAIARGPEDGVDDPWEGHTLEWATTSPPPPGNFAEAPVVRSERPLLDTDGDDDDGDDGEEER